MTDIFERSDDEIAEELRLIAHDERRALKPHDRDALVSAAYYIDWQNDQLIKLREMVDELSQQRQAQLDKVRELQRRPLTVNFYPAIVGSDVLANFGYGVRQ